jgi:hypothetical protein
MKNEKWKNKKWKWKKKWGGNERNQNDINISKVGS